MYDFPASPTPGQEYTPPVGGQTYVWQAPRWLVKGIPPVGGGGGGIPEAPIDSQQYAREDANWSVVEAGVSDWADITGKPATFPPTVPIPWTDVSGKPATFPPTLPIDYTAGISGKPTTFPPTLPIAQSGVTNLTTDLAAKAPLASPVFTGDPQAPTPSVGDNDTSIATTAYVKAQAYAPLASPTFTGDPKAPTPAVGDNDTSIATTEFVKAQGYAPLASPVFTGNPTAPTPALLDNDTSIATTQFVTNAIAYFNYAPKNSPVFTGDPSAPTPSVGDNDTSIATTQFVTRDFVKKAGDTMAGTLTLSTGNFIASNGFVEVTKPGGYPGLFLNYDGANGAYLGVTKAYANRYQEYFDDTAWYLKKYNDAGVGVNALTLTRSDGLVSVLADPTAALGIATKQYVDAKAGVAAASVSDTAPSTPVQGQLWFDSSLGTLYVYYNDGSSSQWVQVVGSG